MKRALLVALLTLSGCEGALTEGMAEDKFREWCSEQLKCHAAAVNTEDMKIALDESKLTVFLRYPRAGPDKVVCTLKRVRGEWRIQWCASKTLRFSLTRKSDGTYKEDIFR